MKSEKIMNVIFYVFNTISVFCFAYVLVRLHVPNFALILILSFYAFTYYCHTEIKNYILETYYIPKNNKDTLNSFIENNVKKMGYADYTVDSEIDINDYTEEQIKKALKSYYHMQ